MELLDFIRNRKSQLFTFKNRYGESKTMRAKDIYDAVMKNSRESDYNWIAPAKELVKLCKNKTFPRKFAIGIEVAILNCFANVEARVNRGGDKYITKEDDALAVQFCYDEVVRIEQSTDNEKLKKTLNLARTSYLKEMISSAVNTSTRGHFFHSESFRDLKKEIVGKNFVKYSMQEKVNILDMYEEISNETHSIIMKAYNSGMFR